MEEGAKFEPTVQWVTHAFEVCSFNEWGYFL